MGIFGKPNIEKMVEKGDIKCLIKALGDKEIKGRGRLDKPHVFFRIYLNFLLVYFGLFIDLFRFLFLFFRQFISFFFFLSLYPKYSSVFIDYFFCNP